MATFIINNTRAGPAETAATLAAAAGKDACAQQERERENSPGRPNKIFNYLFYALSLA